MNYESEEMYNTLDNMETYGGSFVKDLARLFRIADSNNKHKLYMTFTEYFIKYHPTNWRHNDNTQKS